MLHCAALTMMTMMLHAEVEVIILPIPNVFVMLCSQLLGTFQPSHEMMLKFYSFYKQASVGPCNISKPAFWDVVGKAKW